MPFDATGEAVNLWQHLLHGGQSQLLGHIAIHPWALPNAPPATALPV